MSTSKITGRQLKAARALLGWSQADLGDKAAISRPTIERIESCNNEPVDSRHVTAAQVIAALQAVGIVFIGDTGVNLLGTKRRR